jgi:hypothetical protein
MNSHRPSENLPAFLPSSAEVFNTSRLSVESRHGKQLVDFATHWARIMQQDMEEAPLSDIWVSAYYKADILGHGLTGNHLPIVAGFLARCWKHGEPFWQLYDRHWGTGCSDDVR